MVSRARNTNWGDVVARLRRGVAAGNGTAMTELAITINDGVRDGAGRVLVRPNPPYAVRLLRRAVESGDENAAGSLGYAYDVGHGVRRDKALALEWYRRAVRHGDCGAASNIATAHADDGDRKHAIQFLKRANGGGDYPEAASMLAQLNARVELTPCRCRRYLRKNLNGHAPCPQHPISGRPAVRRSRR